jgi:hypothetical protein
LNAFTSVARLTSSTTSIRGISASTLKKSGAPTRTDEVCVHPRICMHSAATMNTTDELRVINIHIVDVDKSVANAPPVMLRPNANTHHITDFKFMKISCLGLFEAYTCTKTRFASGATYPAPIEISTLIKV